MPIFCLFDTGNVRPKSSPLQSGARMLPMDPVRLLRVAETAMGEAKENLEELRAKYSKEQEPPVERLKEVGEVLK